MSIKNDIIMVFKEGDPHCVHEVAARIGKDVTLVQIYLSTLTRDGLLVKCGDTGRCKLFASEHTFWNYAGKDEMITKREENVKEKLNGEIEQLNMVINNKDVEMGLLQKELDKQVKLNSSLITLAVEGKLVSVFGENPLEVVKDSKKIIQTIVDFTKENLGD
jgi:hypothetical protein